MLAEQAPLGVEEQNGAIEGAAVALDDTDDEGQAMLFRRGSEFGGGRTGDVNRGVPVAEEVVTALGAA